MTVCICLARSKHFAGIVMDPMDEEDWCQTDRSDFIKDDCLVSSFQSSDLQYYADCYNKGGSACQDAHCLLQSSKTETTTEYADIISDNDMMSLDAIHMPLEEQLNLASNLFDVKIPLNSNYPNGMFHKSSDNFLTIYVYT